MKKYYFIGILLFSVEISAQKFETQSQLWGGYFSSVKLNQRFSINADLQGRTTDWYKQWSQVLVRTGSSFKLNEKFALSAGFADFVYFQKGNRVSRNEYRPWIEGLIADRNGKLQIFHRFRFEDRNFQFTDHDVLVGKYSQNYRSRYKIDFQYPLWSDAEENKSLIFQIGNEIMINAGNSIINNFFDQNRSSIGVLYAVNKNFAFQLQYLEIVQQLPGQNSLANIHVVRFNIHHTIIL